MTMYLTDSPIVMPAEGIAYRVRRISADTAFFALDDEGFTSVIGHQGTVDVLKTIFPGLGYSLRDH
jgi:hypothetical protein